MNIEPKGDKIAWTPKYTAWSWDGIGGNYGNGRTLEEAMTNLRRAIGRGYLSEVKKVTIHICDEHGNSQNIAAEWEGRATLANLKKALSPPL